MLDAPPEAPKPNARNWQRLLMMLPMVAGAAAMGLMMSAGRGGPIIYVAGGMYGVSVLGMIAMQLANQGGQSKKEMIEARRQYMRRLSQLRAQVRGTIQAQREALHYRHPDPDRLWSTVLGQRIWERRRGDGDFAVVRIGLGPHEIATPLVPPTTKPVDELEPLCAAALRQFVTAYSVVPDLPVALSLRDFSRVYIRGEQDAPRSLVRALVAQVVAVHSPDDMLVAFCVANETRPWWEWAKWLPHALHPTKVDDVGQLRLVAPSVSALEAMLDDVLANRPRFGQGGQAVGPHLIVVFDGGTAAGSDHLMTEGGVGGVTIVDLSNQPPRLLDENSVVLDIAPDGTVSGTTVDGKVAIGRADTLDLSAAEALARELAPMRLSAATVAAETPMAGDTGLAELLKLGDPYEFDLAQQWASRPSRDRLRVPIGVGPDGRPVELDLKESAQDGMGPHGLLVGATGSGKSELLRTLVLALAVTHSSEILNFVLVDFKGGATFTKLDRLAHTSAVITNLENELPLVDRMQDAIRGELVRRQELLRAAGNYASQRDYERARAAGVPLAPLPSLLIIVDEFSELLTARPDFIDLFVQIGRIGRSIGVHLLLASQRLEEGRLRGLETHLSYRIGLRTFSSMESRAVLGVPDAYELPRSPGHGYLKAGTDQLVRFRAAYVSGVYRRGDTVHLGTSDARTDVVRPYTTQYLALTPTAAPPPEPVPQPQDDVLGETLLDVIIGRLEGHGPPAHQVWLPPLKEPPTLDQLLPRLTLDPRRGLTTSAVELQGALRAVVGIIDRPAEQRRDLLWFDLAGSAGNMMVVGGPRSGKSTLLRTFIASLCLTHTPAEAQFYCLDFGGGALTSLRDLPHVGAVATRREATAVRRTIAEVRAVLVEREQRFAALGIDGIGTYRRRRAAGEFSDDPYGDVFLVVDGWGGLRSEYEDQEPLISELASRGLGFGIHVIASAGRWMDVRPAARDAFGSKVELRLGETSDSLINRRAAANVPDQTPGRGLTPEAFHFLAGLPRVDGVQDADTLADGVAAFVQAVASSWTGQPAPRVRRLPDELPYSALPAPVPGERAVPIGIAEADLAPVFLDFSTDPHLLVFGDVESGKSSFLRALATGISQRYSPKQARIIVVDYRRSLLGAVSQEHLLGYGTSAQVTTDMIKEVVGVMAGRLPGPDITPEQLRDRSWWKGAELFLLVDDYDLVSSGPGGPLSPLLEYLAHGRDIGLHVVIARRTGGAARALFEPVIGRIRELASPGILLSGPREEGPLLGNVRPQPLPPGRALLVTRRAGTQLVQLGWLPPPSVG